MSNFLTKVKTGLAKRRVFRSVFGVSFALVFLTVVIGAPHAVHAGFWADLIGNVSDATFGLIFRGIGYVILMLANFIIFLVGMLFNEVIIYTVFQFGNYFGNSAGLLAGWGALRDVANIILIFGFVMLGLATILDIHGYEVKKTLPRLIIFAILLNFSLLASEAVIDTANAFAALLYTQASQTCTSGTQQDCASQGSTDGISGAVFQLSGVSSSFAVQEATDPAKDADNTHYAIAYIGMAIFVTVLAVVLLAGAIMLITRGVVLSMLMILSPLGFAGLAVPPLEKYAKDWWHRLLSQAFFAPLYLLLILVGLKVAQGVAGPNRNLMSALTTGDATAIGSIVIFAILAGFMVAALVVAKQMGAMGASAATSMAGSAIIGGTAFVGRRTVGAGAQFAAERLNNSKFGRSRSGQMLVGGLNRTAAGSFDARSYGSSVAGVNLGKAGGKGGYAHELHDKEEARIKAGKKLGLSRKEERAIAAMKEAQAAQATTLAGAHNAAAAPGQEKIKDLQAQIKTTPEGAARNALVNEMLAEQEELRKLQATQAQERTTMEKGHAKAVQEAKDAPQRQFADALHHAPRTNIPVIRTVLNPILSVVHDGIGGHADHHAAEKMLKELKKDPKDRAEDAKNAALIAALDKAAKGGGGGGHAPAPAAAAGGGGGGGGHH